MEFTKLSSEQVKNLDIREKIAYQTWLNKERQKKYRENNKEKITEYNRIYAKQYRENNKEKCRELSKKRSKIYRDKMKSIKNNLLISDILNDIINNI